MAQGVDRFVADVNEWTQEFQGAELVGCSPADLSAEFMFSDGERFSVSFSDQYPIVKQMVVVSEDAELLEAVASAAGDEDSTIGDLLGQAVDQHEGAEEDSDGSDDGLGSGADDDDDGDGYVYEDDDGYVDAGDDAPASKYARPRAEAKDDKPRLLERDFVTQGGSPMATNRLLQDLETIQALNTDQFGYRATPRARNLYTWDVQLLFHDADDCSIKQDLATISRRGGVDAVHLELKFFDDYPFSPPFVRVVKPRFQFRTGHVTCGGSICMEVLTASGWSSVVTIDSLMVQIRAEMMAGGARLDTSNNSEYSESDAWAAFARVARDHSWELPAWLARRGV